MLEIDKNYEEHNNYAWVINCIRSCRNHYQLDCCINLINLYSEKYPNMISLTTSLVEEMECLKNYLDNQCLLKSIV